MPVGREICMKFRPECNDINNYWMEINGFVFVVIALTDEKNAHFLHGICFINHTLAAHSKSWSIFTMFMELMKWNEELFAVG